MVLQKAQCSTANALVLEDRVNYVHGGYRWQRTIRTAFPILFLGDIKLSRSIPFDPFLHPLQPGLEFLDE